ncbi:MAG: DUF4340 domain-containing protein [Bacteroidales bacterium]|jgi:hypothetical protein|nr:DUF4340 domain-containing protein [Bacteroidales bacterium]
MKKNRVTLIIALILLLTAFILFITNSYSTLSKESSEFAIEDTASVIRIFIADKNNNEVTLDRSEGGGWLVDGKYPAQQAKVSSFLKTLMDLEVRSPVPLVARNNVITRMSVIAKKIEIYQVVPRINIFSKIRLFPHEKLTRVYYVGDVTQDNQGTFMLMEGAEEPYVVHIPGFRGFVSTRYSTVKADWRDYTVFRTPIGEIQSVRVEFPFKPGQSYQFDVKDNQHISLRSLADDRELQAFDTIRALNFLTGFEDIRFESLLEHLIEKEFIDSVASSTPKTIITLTDRNGEVNRVKLFTKKGFAPLYSEDGALMEPVDLDRAYALVNDEEDFVLVQYYVFDRITRTLDFLTGKE